MYFDNASTTKIDSDIISEINELNEKYFYNPGALYSRGREVRKIIDNSRSLILDKLNADGYKIYFTASATEANNLAIRGVLKKNIGKILVSIGEHPSVYNTMLDVKEQGYDVEFLNLDKTGKVDIDDFKRKMNKNVGLISIMHVSNETGAINDISSIVEYARSVNPNVIIHSDGVQAVGKIDVDIENIDVDLYTISAHKIHGLKGVGALIVRNNIKLKPIIFGGGQELGVRSGTENLIGIFSLSRAVEKVIDKLDENYKYVTSLKNKFIEFISRSGLKYSLNSCEDNSPYIVSISFDNCRSETLLNMLDDCGVYIGNGSACSSKNSGNRILESMGVSKLNIEGNLRISFSKFNTFEDVDSLCLKLQDCVTKYLDTVRK